MSVWRRSVRGTLILCVLGVGAAVVIGLRDRAEPARALVVERTDPDAVIQTRGSRVVRADALGENLRVVADRQDTYQDGSLRLVDNVQVTLATREDRPGFVLTGNEATLDASKTAVELTGTVDMESSDGLSASTEHASYSDRDGVIRMPGPTTFRRDGLNATGDGAEYDRENDVLHLRDNARVDLISNTTRTRIRSRVAVLAQTDRYMEFSGDVTIETDSQRMMARRARAALKSDGTTVETLDLMGNARIVGTDPQPGNLRDMTARTIGITYSETGTALDTAVLTGGSHLEIAATDGATGSTIRSQSIRLTFDDDGRSLAELVARNEVELTLPVSQAAATQTVSANLLTVTGQSGAGLELARFDGDVTFRAVSFDDAGAPVTTVTSADRLFATLADGMTRLEEIYFLGDVTFENGDVVGVGDEAIYAIDEGRVELMLGDSTGRAPRVDDGRGSVQANLIALDVHNGQITAEGEVESVLLADLTDANTEPGARRPGLLEPSEPTYVTAGHLAYGGATDVAVYSQGARLWQAATEFVADRITLDEGNGNIGAEGNVRTRSMISQVNDETGRREESISTRRTRSSPVRAPISPPMRLRSSLRPIAGPSSGSRRRDRSSSACPDGPSLVSHWPTTMPRDDTRWRAGRFKSLKNTRWRAGRFKSLKKSRLSVAKLPVAP
jgi:LPS export ABC transporter protein LptC